MPLLLSDKLASLQSLVARQDYRLHHKQRENLSSREARYVKPGKVNRISGPFEPVGVEKRRNVNAGAVVLGFSRLG